MINYYKLILAGIHILFTLRSRALGAQTLAYRASNNRNSIASNTRNSLRQTLAYRASNTRNSVA